MAGDAARLVGIRLGGSLRGTFDTRHGSIHAGDIFRTTDPNGIAFLWDLHAFVRTCRYDHRPDSHHPEEGALDPRLDLPAAGCIRPVPCLR